jgi:hypothetical protein
MMSKSRSALAVVVAIVAMLAFAMPAAAQITTGTVSGTVKDAQGGVIPGATVTLISEARGTRMAPAVTNTTGDFVIANVTPDTYTVEVTMPSFKTTSRKGVAVSGGDRVAVGTLVLEVGGTSEVVDVTAEAPLIQAESGERSFAVSTTQIENLPISHANFTSFIALVPGVRGGANQNGARVGSSSQDNIMMDGISAMDTGNNGQMLNMNIESIAEVKVLTQAYQAEYGRSSGLQITAVTKSGTNRFHGSLYDVQTNSDWNTIGWAAKQNGDKKVVSKNKTLGYSIGGPVGKPGGENKLFFFYSHEYRPSTGSGSLNRFRVPTALERTGDFSQTLDNTGKPFPYIRDASTGLPCSASNTSGCFQDGGVLGKIPANRLYSVGLGLLNRYPLPNLDQAVNTDYNLEIPRPADSNLTQQPAIRVDYQFSPSLRVTGKFSGERQRQRIVQGTMPGFNDVLVPYPYISNPSFTVNYTLNPTTFIEATYGSIKNELAGGGSGGILVNESANRLNGVPDLPLLYPDAGVVDPRYYQLSALQRTGAIYFDGTRVNLPPNFAWGSRVGPDPVNQQYPGWLNVNKTQDFAVSLTKVVGHHTMKTGFYNNHSFKAQNTGAGGTPNLSFQGYINFGEDSNNPADTGFGFANAALGTFSQYLQASKLIEGNMIYNNTEFYVQDNWKVNSRFTLDYGLRFTHQGMQADQFGQMSNFFPDKWSASAAPMLFVPGCSNGAVTCSGATRVAKNPLTGAFAPAAAIGTVVPNSGDRLNGIRSAFVSPEHPVADDINKASYVWPNMVFGPRFGAAYDLTGTQRVVIRGGIGLFYDRPDGNTVFSIPGNPPISDSQDLRYGNLQTIDSKNALIGVPALSIFQYDAKVASSVQWNAGVQMALPWSSSLDVSYVGNHGYNRLGGFQAGSSVNLNAVDIGTAYLPQYQDPTLGPSSVPGKNAYTTNLLRPYRGYSTIAQQTTDFHDMFHSIQTSFNRRFRNGVQFGANYTLTLSQTGNTGLQKRLVHAPDGTISISPDQAAYEDLLSNTGLRRHIIKANAVWDLPDIHAESGAMRAIGYLANDWQLSGVLTAGSGSPYDLGFSYQNDGGNVNLTGSPDYGARIIYTGDPGSGCSDNQYAQFNVHAVTGPGYGSTGLESGRNLLTGCPDHTVDLALARNIRLGGGRQVQLRLDAYNAFNTVIISGRSSGIQYVSPTDLTIRNEQFPNGQLDQNRLTPRTAGFGAATGAQGGTYLRTIQLTARFSF